MLAAVALIMGSTGASAQQVESRLIGTITDPNRSSLPGVTVTATSTTTGAVRTATSDDQGRYTLTQPIENFIERRRSSPPTSLEEGPAGG